MHNRVGDRAPHAVFLDAPPPGDTGTWLRLRPRWPVDFPVGESTWQPFNCPIGEPTLAVDFPVGEKVRRSANSMLRPPDVIFFTLRRLFKRFSRLEREW